MTVIKIYIKKKNLHSSFPKAFIFKNVLYQQTRIETSTWKLPLGNSHFLLEQTVCAPASLQGYLALRGGADICFACGGGASHGPSGFLPPIQARWAKPRPRYHRG